MQWNSSKTKYFKRQHNYAAYLLKQRVNDALTCLKAHYVSKLHPSMVNEIIQNSHQHSLTICGFRPSPVQRGILLWLLHVPSAWHTVLVTSLEDSRKPSLQKYVARVPEE